MIVEDATAKLGTYKATLQKATNSEFVEQMKAFIAQGNPELAAKTLALALKYRGDQFMNYIAQSHSEWFATLNISYRAVLA